MFKTGAFAVFLAGTILLSLSSPVFAHKPLLSVGDNQDGTVSVEAGFSDGASAAGHKIILKDEKTGSVIAEHRVGEDGTLQLKKPSVPYIVVLDAGEGHVVSKTGPAPSPADSSPAADTSVGDAPRPAAAIKSPEAVSSPPPSPAAGPADTLRAGPSRGVEPSWNPSPGATMAFNMMVTTQIVIATALIFILAVVCCVAGYTVGYKKGAFEGK
jgi:hypothetical protein